MELEQIKAVMKERWLHEEAGPAQLTGQSMEREGRLLEKCPYGLLKKRSQHEL